VKHRVAVLVLALALAAPGSDKGPPTAQASNASVAIVATLYLGKDAVRDLLGTDLGGGFQVVKVQMTPKGAKPLNIDLDDFLLRSFNDGGKCQPYAPSQIAGRTSLAVVPVGGGGVRTEQGPVFGIPGGGIGMPRRSAGNSTAGSTGVDTKTTDSGKDDPVLKLLKEKVLPEKQTSEPVSGLLYFGLDGKHKPKDITLEYKTPSGPLRLEFR
jgi:hypothetical protein